MYYEITKTANSYIFEHVDEDGDRWYLGEAIERVQDEGQEDEYRWYEGHFDTRELSFENDYELDRWLDKHMHNAYTHGEIVWA